MLYILPTPRGRGVDIWGTFDDMEALHTAIGHYWEREEHLTDPAHHGRDLSIMGFSYEVRKAYEGMRMQQPHSNFSTSPNPHFGCRMSWVQILFAMSAIYYNMRYNTSTAEDLSVFLHIESELESAMLRYDMAGGQSLKPFLHGAIYTGSEFFFQLMMSIHEDHLRSAGGKASFRRLATIMQRSTYQTYQYIEYTTFLYSELKRLACKPSELHFETDIDYGKLKW